MPQQPNIAIILASGTGSRFRSETPKQFLKLAGKTVLEHTLAVFERHEDIDEIILVTSSQQRILAQEIANRAGFKKLSKIINGGATRKDSSRAGVLAVTDDNAKVLVHDAARPLLDAATIGRCLAALDTYHAVDTGIASPDTVIQLDKDNCIQDIPPRSELRLGQTPQAFRAGLLKQAHQRAQNDSDIKVTDDCGLILHYDLGAVHVVEGNVSNIKITYPSDIYLADRLFQLRTRSQHANSALDLTGKVVVVFGASRGIGEQITLQAQNAGAQVISASRATGVDITNAQSVRQTLHKTKQLHGRVDLVANTAGILRTGLLAGQSLETITQEVNINILGSIIVAREAFETMKNTGGSIALFTSSSYTRGRARSAVYSASKAAVVNLMQGLAEEYLPFKVRINAINPERTATPMRTENFGTEPAESLLSAQKVAQATLNALTSEATGEVIDVRRE